MKRIFIIGATLLAAGGAFGFTKIADSIISASVATAPLTVYNAERIQPTRSDIKSVSSAKITPAIAELPLTNQPVTEPQNIKPIATAFAAPNTLADANTPDGTAPAQYNTFLPTTDTFYTSGVIASEIAPNPMTEAQRIRFERLSMIGVYR